MYSTEYECGKCRKVVRFSHVKEENPLRDQQISHKEVKQRADELKDVTVKVYRSDQTCEGALKFKKTETVPYTSPITAFQVSFEYSLNSGNKDRINTICGGIDFTNTKIKKKGVNAHGKRIKDLHDTLERIIRTKVQKIEKWNIENCAEIDAVDELLKINVELKNIRVYSRDKQGRPKPPCENCQCWLIRGSLKDQDYKIRL